MSISLDTIRELLKLKEQIGVNSKNTKFSIGRVHTRAYGGYWVPLEVGNAGLGGETCVWGMGVDITADCKKVVCDGSLTWVSINSLNENYISTGKTLEKFIKDIEKKPLFDRKEKLLVELAELDKQIQS